MTAEEVADAFCIQHRLHPKWSSLFAQILTAYAEERVREVNFKAFDHVYAKALAASFREQGVKKAQSCVCTPQAGPCGEHQHLWKAWRAEALEECIKIANTSLDYEWVANQIRALKGKP